MTETAGIEAVPALAWLGRVAFATALVFTVLLAWRPIGGSDIGYHLAYGETFLNTGHVVDSDAFIYVPPRAGDLDSIPGNRPPGAWIDSGGGFRFPNANYGSQIAMALVYRIGGFTGLCLLQAALVALVMLVSALTMRRLGVDAAWIAAGLVLIAMVSHDRFRLRPEMFGLAVLAVMAMVIWSPRPPRRSAVVMLILLHWAAMQLHSSWVLGFALVGAVWAQELLSRFRDGPRSDDETRAGANRLRFLSIALGGMTVVSFLNPWTWRLVALPFQTIAYLSANHIPGDPNLPGQHPWSSISEFQPPFEGPAGLTRSTAAYLAMLALTAIAMLPAALRGKWSRLAVMVLMVAVSLKMRRNLAFAAVVVVPLALASLNDLRTSGGGGRPLLWVGRCFRAARIPAAVAAILLSVIWSFSLVSGRFYYVERRPVSFGVGYEPSYMPIEGARVLARLPVDVRVFTSFNLSSTVMFFGRDATGFRDVPILTNTWAYPAYTTMAVNANLCLGRPLRGGRPDFRPFLGFADRYDIGIAVLDCNTPNAGLARFLLNQRWQWVRFDGRNLVLLRPDLACPKELKDTATLAEVIDDVRRRESHPAYSLSVMAVSYLRLGFPFRAESCWRACVEDDPTYREAWLALGRLLYDRGTKTGSKETLAESRECLLRATRSGKRHEGAERLLADLEHRLR